MVKVVFNIVLLSILSSLLFAQESNKIAEKNSELQLLRNEVSRLETDLRQSEKTEEHSINTLAKIKEQNFYLNKVINNLIIVEKNLGASISKLTDTLRTIEASIKSLRKSYSDYVKWIYMYGQDSMLDLFASSGSVNRALVRYKYFSYITSKNQEVLEKLKLHKIETENLKTKIQTDREEKNRIIEEKEQEVSRLADSKIERENLIAKLRKNQRNIQNEIDRKRIDEVKIKEMIARLEREEREREMKLREERLKGKETAPLPAYNYESFENFRELMGKLNWPVSSGEVIRDFGENKNEDLNTVTLNYGIDIETKDGTEVYVVAEGIVSAIDWIPGYGSIVIVTHKGKFRTVYGHITDIKVNEGDVVKGGDKLGDVSSSLEGSIIHFEVWQQRNYQNPRIWLVKE